MQTSPRLATLTRLAALPLAASLLVACGGGDGGSDGGGDETASSGSGDASESSAPQADSAYCQGLESVRALSGGEITPEKQEEALGTLRSLAAEAPAEVEAPWKKLDSTIGRFQDAIDATGLDVAQLRTLKPNQLPEGVTTQELQRVYQEYQALASPEYTASVSEIAEHAKSACGLDLSASPSS